jgi:hypothetical protein
MAQKGVYAALFEKQTQGGESIEEIKIWSSIKWILSTANGLLSTADSSCIKFSIQILARFLGAYTYRLWSVDRQLWTNSVNS